MSCDRLFKEAVDDKLKDKNQINKEILSADKKA